MSNDEELFLPGNTSDAIFDDLINPTENIIEDNYITVNNVFDGKPITYVMHEMTETEIKIASPLTGSHFIKKWDISQQDATGLNLTNATANNTSLTATSLMQAPYVANNYLTKGLSNYQGLRGYSFNRRYESQNGNLDDTFDNGYHGVNSSQVSGYRPRNSRNTYPLIENRNSTPHDPIDYQLSVTGTINIGGYRKAKKIMLWLVDSNGDTLIFTKANSSDRNVLEHEFTDHSTNWKIDIPPLRNPYFGVVSIQALLVYQEGVEDFDGSPPPENIKFATKYTTKARKEIVFLGLQLGIIDSSNHEEKTHATEELVTDFSDQRPIRNIGAGIPTNTPAGRRARRQARTRAGNAAKGRFRTRRMQIFPIENRSRSIFWKNYDNTWTPENRTSPAMPLFHLETQILGLTNHAISLIYRNKLDADYISGPLSKVQKENLNKLFSVETDWNVNINYTSGDIRPAVNDRNFSVYSASNNISGSTSCLLVNQPVRSGGTPDTLPTGYRVGHKQVKPLVPPATEVIAPSAGLHTRHWKQFDDSTNNGNTIRFGYEATTIGWAPVVGEWRDQNGVIIGNPTAASSANPTHHFIQRICCGDMIVSAKITLFHKTYELFLPSIRVEGKNPTLLEIREVLSVTKLSQAIEQVSTDDVLTAGVPNRTRRAYISEFIQQFGEREWLNVCANIIWHESGSNAPIRRVNRQTQLRQQNDNQEAYHFQKKYSEYKLYGTNCHFVAKNQPNFGAPGGWSLAQLDNAPPTELQIWHWDHAVAEMLRRLIVHKMVNVIRGRLRLNLLESFALARPRVVRGRVEIKPGYAKVIGNHLAPIERSFQVDPTLTRIWYSNLERRGDYAGHALYSADINERQDAVKVIAWLSIRAYNGGQDERSWNYMYKVGKDTGMEQLPPYNIGIPMPAANP